VITLSCRRCLRVLVPLLVVVSLATARAQESVSVRVDCREGIGLIPALWRGVATDGRLPEGVEVKTARLDPQIVQKAWNGRLAGAAYTWSALDGVLDSMAARGVEVILPLPVPPEPALDGLWADMIHDTASHVSGRVSRFEIWGGNSVPAGGDEHYLDYYESAVWAIYRADSNARVGGPGASWSSRNVELLVWGCGDRSLPLSFVSWRADSVANDGLRQSVEAVQEILGRHRLAERPRQVVSAWSVGPDTVVAASIRSVQAVLSVLDTDLAAVCLDMQAGSGSLDVLRALQDLGLVRVMTAIDENPWGLAGIVSLDGEEVIGLLWQTASEEGAVAAMEFSGLPNGSRARVRRFTVAEGMSADEPVDTQSLRLQEPLSVRVPVPPGVLTVIRVDVE
jgi:hypothetical protein